MHTRASYLEERVQRAGEGAIVLLSVVDAAHGDGGDGGAVLKESAELGAAHAVLRVGTTAVAILRVRHAIQLARLELAILARQAEEVDGHDGVDGHEDEHNEESVKHTWYGVHEGVDDLAQRREPLEEPHHAKGAHHTNDVHTGEALRVCQ